MSFATGFRDFIKAISPPWLRVGVAEKFLYTLAIGADLLIEKLQEGMYAHMPGKQEDSSALALQGADRMIGRGLAEPDDTYSARLRRALDSWAHAGSALSELQALLGYIFPASLGIRLVTNSVDPVTTVARSVWYTLEAGATSSDTPRVDLVEPANWNWDGVYSNWWRTWIVIYVPASLWVPEATWGSGTWGDGGVWGLSATPGQIADLRSIVRLWKAKHSWCQWIILAFDTTTFQPYHAAGGGVNPDGTYAQWSKYSAGLQQETRIDSARYVDGTPYRLVRGGAGSIIDTIGV